MIWMTNEVSSWEGFDDLQINVLGIDRSTIK